MKTDSATGSLTPEPSARSASAAKIRGFQQPGPRARFSRIIVALLLAAKLPAVDAATGAATVRTNSPIPFPEIGARATADYRGNALGIEAADGDARLRSGFQKLEAQATPEGLWLASTDEAGGRLRLVATGLGRADLSTLNAQPLTLLSSTGVVSVSDRRASFRRPGLVEEYSVSVDGVRQDFVIAERPAGAGELRVDLSLAGASAESAAFGAKLRLDESGRELAYSRLSVVDAGGKQLTARLEVVSDRRLVVWVGDATALYPVRIDPTFSDADWVSMNPGVPGVNGIVKALAVDGNGNVYLGGDFTLAGNVPAHGVAKWDGNAWSALGAGVEGDVLALAASGTDLYVGGYFFTAGNLAVNHLAKWNGSAWSALGDGVNDFVHALAVSGTDLYAGGSFTTAGGSPAGYLAKWDGSAWSTLGAGMDDAVYSLAVSGTDLYAGGRFTAADGVANTRYLARWNGSAWSAVGTGMNGEVYALAASGTDLYAGGGFTSASGVPDTRLIAKWNGSAWSALGIGMNNVVRSLAVSGTDLYAGGSFTVAGGLAADHVAQWNGSAWSALGAGANGTTYALAVSGAQLFVGGDFRTAGGVNVDSIAKWDGLVWSGFGTGMNGTIRALAVRATDLFIGGEFTVVDGVPGTAYVARWNGTAWSALGTGMNGAVYALAGTGSDLYAGGAFTTAGGLASPHLAKWDGSAWSAWDTKIDDAVYALAVKGSDLLVGGRFTTAGGVSDTRYVARWDGSAWSSLGSGLDDSVFALAVEGSDVFAGGDFLNAGGASAQHIAKWNGIAWQPLGTGVDRRVSALAVSGTDVFVGGLFDFAGGIPGTAHVARWNSASWSALGAGTGAAVYALAAIGDDLYVAGDFVTAGGTAARRIAKWNGSAWSALGSGLDRAGFALAADSVGHLFVGGQFGVAGTNVSPFLAQANLPAEISLEQPSGGDLKDGVAQIQFGNGSIGAVSVAKTFTLRNVGAAPLNIVGVSVTGGEAADFEVNTTGMAVSVPGGGATTFEVTFHPAAAGPRTTTLQVVSDDEDESTFDVTLTGTGVDDLPQIAVDLGSVTVAEGEAASNSGTFSDLQGNATVTLSASVGSITPNFGAGTWSWSFTSQDGPAESQVVTVFARNGNNPAATATFQLRVDNVAPTALPQALSTDEDVPRVITLAATDPGADARTYEIVAPPAAGEGSLSVVSGDQVTFTPARDFNGQTQFSFVARDSDGAAGSPAIVQVTVNSVNDVPAFTKGPAQTVGEDAGPQIVPGWASAIRAGPPDEAGQVLTFTVKNDNAGLFSVPPAISPGGTLTYTPALNAHGFAVVAVTLTDDAAVDGIPKTSPLQTFRITVTPVNDPPGFTKGADQTMAEDAGPQTVPGWASAISVGPADEAGQALTFNVGNDNAGLFSVPPAISPDGTLTYTAAPDANGQATVSVTLTDDTTVDGVPATSAAQTFTITVTPVNDTPRFTLGADQTVAEDSGPRVVVGWATGISAGAGNEVGQVLTFNVGNDNPGLFAVPPFISGGGTLSYKPAPNASGSAMVTVSLTDDATAGGPALTTALQSFKITVTPVNDPPSFAKGADQTVAEDAGPQTVPGWATAISAGPADEAGQVLTFDVSNDNAGLFSVPPAVATDGTLTYTPAPDANGIAIVAVTLTDDPTVDGVAATTAPQKFTITVTPANDAPRFTSGAGQTVLEDAGPQTVAGWATGISAGAANEQGQVLTFNVGNDNAGLFAVPPSVSANGTLTYTPAPDANGSATVSVSLTDDDTAGGLAITTGVQKFTITVTAVNDAPSFTKGPAPTVPEDAGPQAVPGWARDIKAGPANEAGQALTFIVRNDNAGLFSVPPAVASDGTLTFTPTQDAHGKAVVAVTLTDDDTAGGPAITSRQQTFLITVNPVNDAPSFTKGADQVAAEDAGPQIVPGWATAISAGPADEAGQVLTFNVSSDNAGLFSVPPAIAPNGTLTYTPAPNANGTANVSVTLTDDATVDGVAATSTPQAFTITVTSVNDLPTIGTIRNQRTEKGQSTAPIQIIIHDDDAGDVDLATLTGESSDPTVVDNQDGFEFSGAGSRRFLVIKPVPGQVGKATLTVTVKDPAGATASTSFDLLVFTTEPQIITQPVGWVVDERSGVSLDVQATGGNPLAYQWYRSNSPSDIVLSGETNRSLVIAKAQLTDGGNYYVVVTNRAGRAVSQPAKLTVRRPSMPLVGDTSTRWDAANRTLTLASDAIGEEPLTFQWLRNGVALTDGAAVNAPLILSRGSVSGATAPELVITGFQAADAGRYSVRVANSNAVVEGLSVPISVEADPLPRRDPLPDAPYVAEPTNRLVQPALGTVKFGKIETVEIRDNTNRVHFTVEPDERPHAGKTPALSGWFVWSSDIKGVASFATAGSSFDTQLAVYQLKDPNAPPAFTNLQEVVSDDDGGGFQTSYVRFNADSNTVYFIAVAGREQVRAEIVLNWSLEEGPAVPVISVQPESLAVPMDTRPDAERQLSVTLANPDPGFAFAWFRNGIALQEGVGGFTDVDTPTLNITGWNPDTADKVALYHVVITNPLAGLRVESNRALIEFVGGSASVDHTTRTKLDDVFIPTDPNQVGGGRKVPVLQGEGTSGGTIYTPGQPNGTGLPDGCGLATSPVWRLMSDQGFPANSHVAIEATSTNQSFSLSLWTSQCRTGANCLSSRTWICAQTTDGVARLDFAPKPEVAYYVLNVDGAAAGNTVKITWTVKTLTKRVRADFSGWLVVETKDNPGLTNIVHLSDQTVPSEPVNIVVRSNPSASRFWFPVNQNNIYAFDLQPDTVMGIDMNKTTAIQRPELKFILADSSGGPQIQFQSSEPKMTVEAVSKSTAGWIQQKDFIPTIDGANRVWTIPFPPFSDAPLQLFRLVPDLDQP